MLGDWKCSYPEKFFKKIIISYLLIYKGKRSPPYKISTTKQGRSSYYQLLLLGKVITASSQHVRNVRMFFTLDNPLVPQFKFVAPSPLQLDHCHNNYFPLKGCQPFKEGQAKKQIPLRFQECYIIHHCCRLSESWRLGQVFLCPILYQTKSRQEFLSYTSISVFSKSSINVSFFSSPFNGFLKIQPYQIQLYIPTMGYRSHWLNLIMHSFSLYDHDSLNK